MSIDSGILEIDAASYYADTTHVSHSMLEVFRESIPLYDGRFVSKTIPAPEPTPEMEFGTIFHASILEPERIQRAIVFERLNWTTKEGRAQKKWLDSERAGVPLDLVVTTAEMSVIKAMRDAVLAHPIACGLVTQEGRNEAVLRWEINGQPCKARMDRVLDTGMLVDLKTAADPSPEAFARACANFGYARQGSWYLDGAEKAVGADGPFVFVVVGKSPPHEVVCYVLDDDALRLGRAQNEEDFAELCRRYETGDWSSRWKGIQELALPKWAFYK